MGYIVIAQFRVTSVVKTLNILTFTDYVFDVTPSVYPHRAG
jgi:hypothetical protein